jgi:3-hydroxybutyryl-CoA dehydrogenase
MRLVVIGAGLMGSQIGCEFALGGHHVVWVARSLGRAREAVEQVLRSVRALELASEQATAGVLAGVEVVEDVTAVTGSPELVLESVVEDLDVKEAVLRAAALEWPDAILASNTSSLGITVLGERAGAAERFIGMHYANPPMLVPVVELVAGARTEPRCLDVARSLLASIGKQVVTVEHDVPGFIFNRLQFALMREALWLADNGVAAPAVIDEVVRSGLARRWRLTGPFETARLGGLGTFQSCAANLFPTLSTARDPGRLGRWVTCDADSENDGALRLLQRDQALARELRDSREEGRLLGTPSRGQWTRSSNPDGATEEDA